MKHLSTVWGRLTPRQQAGEAICAFPDGNRKRPKGCGRGKSPSEGRKVSFHQAAPPRKVTSPCITPCTCTRTQPRSPLPRSSRAAPTFRTEEKLPTSTGKHGARAGPGPRAAPTPCLSSAGSQIMPLHFRQSSLMGHTMLPNSFFF